MMIPSHAKETSISYRYFISQRLTAAADGDSLVIRKWEVGDPRVVKLEQTGTGNGRRPSRLVLQDTFGIRGLTELFALMFSFAVFLFVACLLPRLFPLQYFCSTYMHTYKP